MSVAFAKYDRSGAPMKRQYQQTRHPQECRKIFRPVFRDFRKYSDVVSRKKKLEEEKTGERVIPSFRTLNVEENMEGYAKIQHAIIAETAAPLNIPTIKGDIASMPFPVDGTFYLSPTRLLISFKTESECARAVEESSPLWRIFDDVRVWSEGEYFTVRLVWVECFGIHPKCWSIENIQKIGAIWGPVIQVDGNVGTLPSLTSGIILLRTKAQNRIDARCGSKSVATVETVAGHPR
ncbi:unnamed protein product [Amaranthus hypochondriacus]